MKKLLPLCLISTVVLTACSGVSAADFLAKVKEKNANLNRTEYNTVELSGVMNSGGQEVKSTADSVCTVTWVDKVPHFMPKVMTDTFVLAVGGMVTPFAVLTNDIATMLTGEAKDTKVSYSLFGVVAEGNVEGVSGKTEYKWDDELLLTKFYMTTNSANQVTTIDVNVTWKMAN